VEPEEVAVTARISTNPLQEQEEVSIAVSELNTDVVESQAKAQK